MSKSTNTKLNWSSSSKTHVMDGENQLPQFVLEPPHEHWVRHARTYKDIHTQTNRQIKDTYKQTKEGRKDRRKEGRKRWKEGWKEDEEKKKKLSS